MNDRMQEASALVVVRKLAGTAFRVAQRPLWYVTTLLRLAKDGRVRIEKSGEVGTWEEMWSVKETARKFRLMVGTRVLSESYDANPLRREQKEANRLLCKVGTELAEIRWTDEAGKDHVLREEEVDKAN